MTPGCYGTMQIIIIVKRQNLLKRTEQLLINAQILSTVTLIQSLHVIRPIIRRQDEHKSSVQSNDY